MGFWPEFIPHAYLVLQAFNCLIGKFNYLSTARTYQVVMMLVFMDVLVVGVLFAEDDLSEVAAGNKEGQGAIDGGLGDAFMVLPEAQQEVLGLEVFVGLEDPPEDGLSLRGVLQSPGLQIFSEPLFFRLYLFAGHSVYYDEATEKPSAIVILRE